MLRIAVSLLVWASLLAVAAPAIAAQEKAPARTAAANVPKTPVNINSATVAEFESLPGIGAKTAARIIEYRQKNGPFKKVEELMNVRGVGEKSFLKLKPQLTVGPARAEHDR